MRSANAAPVGFLAKLHSGHGRCREKAQEGPETGRTHPASPPTPRPTAAAAPRRPNPAGRDAAGAAAVIFCSSAKARRLTNRVSSQQLVRHNNIRPTKPHSLGPDLHASPGDPALAAPRTPATASYCFLLLPSLSPPWPPSEDRADLVSLPNSEMGCSLVRTRTVGTLTILK